MVQLRTNNVRRTAALTNLTPLSEMLPADVVRLRNSIINSVVTDVAAMLKKNQADLIVRDIQPYTDLTWQYSAASAGTAENWERDMTSTSVGWVQVNSSSAKIADNRWVCVFGLRDARSGFGATSKGATDVSVLNLPQQPVSFVKIDVGGSIKVIWSTAALSAYPSNPVAFSQAGIVLGSGQPVNISYYLKNINSIATAKSIPTYLELIGVTVEPRGMVISP